MGNGTLPAHPTATSSLGRGVPRAPPPGSATSAGRPPVPAAPDGTEPLGPHVLWAGRKGAAHFTNGLLPALLLAAHAFKTGLCAQSSAHNVLLKHGLSHYP